MRKGFALPLILAILLVSVIAVGIGYFRFKSKPVPQPQLTTSSQSISTPAPLIKSTPATDETLNWKTYTDPTLAATFKYPPEWELIPGKYGLTASQKDDWYVYINDPNYGDPSCRGDCRVFGVRISVYNNAQNLDLMSFIKQNFNSLTGGAGDFSKIKLENAALTDGQSYTKVTGFPGSNYYDLYILHNKRVYKIGVGAGVNDMRDDINDTKVKQNLAKFDQILSTFKFL